MQRKQYWERALLPALKKTIGNFKNPTPAQRQEFLPD